jgi:hypothetical protein
MRRSRSASIAARRRDRFKIFEIPKPSTLTDESSGEPQFVILKPDAWASCVVRGLLKKDFDELRKPQAISSSADYLTRIFPRLPRMSLKWRPTQTASQLRTAR